MNSTIKKKLIFMFCAGYMFKLINMHVLLLANWHEVCIPNSWEILF